MQNKAFSKVTFSYAYFDLGGSHIHSLGGGLSPSAMVSPDKEFYEAVVFCEAVTFQKKAD